MTNTPDLIVLEGAVDRLREVDALFNELDVGICALHLEACIAALESRLIKARSGELPMRRLTREVGSPAE